MPRGDGTGPAGMGPMTGRAAGLCAGYGVPGFVNPGGRFYGVPAYAGRGAFRPGRAGRAGGRRGGAAWSVRGRGRFAGRW